MAVERGRARLGSWLAGCAAVIFFASAQAVCADSFLIRQATVHRVTAPSSVADVLVRDGTIMRIAPAIEVPEKAAVVSGQGAHLYPGLILAATSLGLMEINAVRATLDTTEVGGYHPEVQSWTAVNPDSELLPVARANGITHIVPVPLGGIFTGQSGVVALDGWTIEQMTIKRPGALHLFWPDQGLKLAPRELAADKAKWKSIEDQAKERKKQLKEIDDFFEEALAYTRARDQAGADHAPFVRIPAWEAMVPLVKGEVPLMVHAEDFRAIKAAIDWAGARGLRMILAGGRDASMVADLLARKKVAVIFDSVFTQPAYDFIAYDAYFKTPGLLAQAGVKVIFSAGLGGFTAAMARNLPYHAAQAAAFGLSRDEALKGMTLYPAELFGLEKRLGSIDEGKEATFFLADGDILDERTQVTRLWIGGREASLETRHTRLYEKYRQRPAFAPPGKGTRTGNGGN